jgi:hypothetical protein
MPADEPALSASEAEGLCDEKIWPWRALVYNGAIRTAKTEIPVVAEGDK